MIIHKSDCSLIKLDENCDCGAVVTIPYSELQTLRAQVVEFESAKQDLLDKVFEQDDKVKAMTDVVEAAKAYTQEIFLEGGSQIIKFSLLSGRLDALKTLEDV